MQNPIFVDRSFDDFDELTAETRHWDLDFRQLDRGRFHGEVMQLMVGRIQIGVARFDRSLQQHGAAPLGVRTFVIPGASEVKFNWRRKKVTGKDLLLFPPNGEFESVSKTDFHIFTMSVPEELIIPASETAAPLLLSWEKRSGSAYLPQLRNMLANVISAAKADSEFLTLAKVIAELEHELISLLVQTICNTTSSQVRLPNRKRDLAVEQIQRIVIDSKNKLFSVADLCAATQVSQRTLRYAFLERYGVTPKAYLKAIRLNGVRRELKSSLSLCTRINKVAMDWGFWHMGQFAADYRRHFGELPSQTLLRSETDH